MICTIPIGVPRAIWRLRTHVGMHGAITTVKVIDTAIASRSLVYILIYSVVTALNMSLLSNKFPSHHTVL